MITYQLSLGDIANVVILAITAWIVYLYTKAAQRSNDIQERPILNLYAKQNKKDERYNTLKLENVGKGPAYNIVISPLEVNNFIYSFSFNEPNFILGVEQKREINVSVTKPDGGAELYENANSHTFELFIDRLFPRDIDPSQREIHSRKAAIFLVNYEGVNKKSYYSIFRIYPKIWPMLKVYELAIEYVESGDGVCDISQAREICKKKKVLLKD